MSLRLALLAAAVAGVYWGFTWIAPNIFHHGVTLDVAGAMAVTGLLGTAIGRVSWRR